MPSGFHKEKPPTWHTELAPGSEVGGILLTILYHPLLNKQQIPPTLQGNRAQVLVANAMLAKIILSHRA